MDEDKPVKGEWQQDRVHDAGHKEKSEKVGGMHHLHEDWGWWANNVTSIRDLGLHLDNELKSSMHVNKLTSTPFIAIKGIASIWHLLDEETTKIMMQALVLSKLDYCKSLLMGMTDYNLDKLQKNPKHGMQNNLWTTLVKGLTMYHL